MTSRLSALFFSSQQELEAQNGACSLKRREVAESPDKYDNKYGPNASTPTQITEDDNPELASSKALSLLTKIDQQGFCGIEKDSIYGAAIAIPMIARSVDWPGTMTALALRTWFFLVVNMILQGFLLSMIGMEQLMMYPFAGRMHLCDFGGDIPQCPDGVNCQGPGGTVFSYPRLYSYDIWSTRIFLRDTLKLLFPHHADIIGRDVDPGEYGMENKWIRLTCIFIFIMHVVDDLYGTIFLAQSLYRLPTRDEPWILYDEPRMMTKAQAKKVKDMTELDLVVFRVAGMPMRWKAFNLVFVLMPKFALWLSLTCSGVHYLMETAGIVNVIVNAMALTFVLDVDELCFERLCTSVTKHIMTTLEDLPLFDVTREENEEDVDALVRYRREEFGYNRLKKILFVIPSRLLLIVSLQAFFMWTYYMRNCDRTEDGSWVSKTMSLPSDWRIYNPLALMFGIEGEMHETPFWTMPKPDL